MSVLISQMCFELGPNAGAASRELNPYFADGGSGMPSAKTAVDKAVAATAVGKGDGGVAWLTKVRYSLFNGNNNCLQNCSWHNCKYNNCQPNCSWYYCELVKTTTNCRTASGRLLGKISQKFKYHQLPNCRHCIWDWKLSFSLSTYVVSISCR